ncbi:MAG: DUF84 family protein [bacterium]
MLRYSPTITICGSMMFATEMLSTKEQLIKSGLRVQIPEIKDPEDAALESGNADIAIDRKIHREYIRAHYMLISQSEAIIVLNHEKKGTRGYIGGHTLMELGFAHTMHRRIFLWESPDPNSPYYAEILATQPLVIHRDLSKISKYFDSLPTAFITSESDLKMQGLSLTLCDAKMPHQIFGKKVPSGVTEEPMTFEETYAGARGRLVNLKKSLQTAEEHEAKPDLLVSIEGGNHKILKAHNYWGHHVCVMENRDGHQSAGVSQDIEIPQYMWDKVPSQYADLGVLVQQEYGTKSKDPLVYISKGKITRMQFIQDAVRNALAVSS